MPDIHCDNISKTYQVADKDPGLAATLKHFFRRRVREIHAVKEVSFEIGRGEITGFLGPNGAGKTTTLKLLTGLIQPSSGRATILGHNPFKRKAELLRQITLVMGQKQQLLWDLPALDSLRINGVIYDIPKQELTRRIGALGEMLGITDELKQPVRKLSLGQRMKAELMAALVHYPRILFLDEPTLGLDVNAQLAVRQFILDYNTQYDATVLVTSHYMADITALCKRVLVIHEGSLIHDGGLDDLVERAAPYRRISVELSRSIEAEAAGQYGEVEELDGHRFTLLVSPDNVTEVMSRLLANEPVADLSVTEPAIDDIIGQIFTAGSTDGEATRDTP